MQAQRKINMLIFVALAHITLRLYVVSQQQLVLIYCDVAVFKSVLKFSVSSLATTLACYTMITFLWHCALVTVNAAINVECISYD